MKKLLLTVFAACMVFATSAQMKGGVKAGLNLATDTQEFDGDKEKSDMKIGFHIGGYLTYDLSDALSIQPELIYNQMGGTDSEDGIDYTLKLDYISVPVMFTYKLGEQFNIQAGPQIGFLASAKIKAEASGDSEEIDVKDGYKGTDFGANLGIGATFGKLGVDGRYYFGLSNIDDTDDSGDFTEKLGAITFSLRYQLFGE